jgi:hypothetical protein
VVADVYAQLENGIKELGISPQEMVTTWSGPRQAPGVGFGPGDKNGALVDTLPSLPPAMPDKFSVRWTVIMEEVPQAAAPAPAPAAGKPAQPAKPVVPVMKPRDVGYVSIRFTPDMAKLNAQVNAAFAKAGLAPNQLNLEFVKVDLLREEKTVSGWSPAVIIPPLPIHKLPVYPGDKKPPVTTEDWLKYKAAIDDPAMQELIARPPFYPTDKNAEAWISPGGEPPAVIAPPAAPAAPAPAPAPVPVPIRPTGVLPEGLRPGAPNFRRGTVGGPNGPYQGPPGAYIPPAGGNLPPNYRPPSGQNPNLQPQPGLINPVGGQNPNGFNPGLAPAGAADIIVHDITIQEGKTYRYAVRYKLLNPMFNKTLQAVKKVYEKFDIDSPNPLDQADLAKLAAELPPITADSLWTGDVSIEPTAHVFVAKIDAVKGDVDLDIFNWKNGHWHEYNAKKKSPGDPLTANDGKDPTPWTVVDIRVDPASKERESYVILMDKNGTLLEPHYVAKDQADPKLQEFKMRAGAAAAAR